MTLPAALPDAFDGRTVAPLELQLQACSERVCLAPETLVLRVPTLTPARADAR